MVNKKLIHVAAVVLIDCQQRVLTVRKRGTDRFMQPGGKPEPGETGLQTAVREVAEEIGLDLDPDRLTAMGTFSAAAANEADYEVVCENFLASFNDDAEDVLKRLAPAAEIAELRWFPLESLRPSSELAPLLTDQVAPAVREMISVLP